MNQFRIQIHPAQIQQLKARMETIGCTHVSVRTVAPSLLDLVQVEYKPPQIGECPEFMYCRGYFDALNRQ